MLHASRALGAALIATSFLSGCATSEGRSSVNGPMAPGHAAENGRYVGSWSGGNTEVCGGRFGVGTDPVAVRVSNGQVGIPTRSGSVVAAPIEPGGAIRAYDPHSMSWITGSVRNGRLSVQMVSPGKGRECTTAYSAQRSEPAPPPQH